MAAQGLLARLKAVSILESWSLLRVLRALLVPLGLVAAVLWSFSVFGAALWANIFVDGHSDASTLDVLVEIVPVACVFLLPGLVVIGLSRLLGRPDARSAFGIAAVLALPIFTFGYAAPALAISAVPWLAVSVVRRRKLAWPPLDVVSIIGGFILIAFWCYGEAHR